MSSLIQLRHFQLKPGPLNSGSQESSQGLAEQLDIPSFLVFHTQNPVHDEAVFCLSSRLMQWDANIWIVDLRQNLKFWSWQQQRQSGSIFELFEKVLAQSLSEQGGQILSVMAAHPWQALLLLSYLKQKQVAQGLYVLSSPISQQLYQHIQWGHWFALLNELGQVLENILGSRFAAGQFSSYRAKMQRFVKRLTLNGPYALSQLKQQRLKAEIERRYGTWLAKAWEWTFDSDKSLEQQRLKSFPWQDFQFHSKAKVRRVLDYPINQWEHLEPLLIVDFAKLAASKNAGGQDYVKTLCWQIQLFNDDVLNLKLEFRHPYHLLREAPEFKTAVLQAYYAYFDAMKALSERDSDLDLPSHMPCIAWQVEITEQLFLTPAVLDLFPEHLESQVLDEVLQLQNQLPKAIEYYQLQADFQPEQLFCLKPLNHQSKEQSHFSLTPFSLAQWQAPLERPLFFFPEPEQIELAEYLHPQSTPVFLESSSSNWWEESDDDNDTGKQNQDKELGLSQSRLYYRLKSRNKQDLWVFKSADGQWFKQGIYS